MENFKNIKKKNSFLGEYTKVYKDELQAIGAMGIFIGITFFNYYWTVPHLFEADSSFKSIFIKVAFSILLTTSEIASVCFAALMIIAIEGLISNIVYGIKRVNRLTYLPLTKEEEKAVGIVADSGSKDYCLQWIYFLFAEILFVDQKDNDAKAISLDIKAAFANKNLIGEIKSLMKDNTCICKLLEWLADADNLELNAPDRMLDAGSSLKGQTWEETIYNISKRIVKKYYQSWLRSLD